MARILFINTVCTGSTGKICNDIIELATKNGHICCMAYGRGATSNQKQSIKIGNRFYTYLHVIKTRLTDKHGFGSKHATKLFLKEIDKFNPDIIHIHNIHGYYINIELLFDYFKKNPNIKIIWTLHDCWPLTGHCSYFLYNCCSKWQAGCYQCEFKSMYPKSYTDNSRSNYMLKKLYFNNVPNMIITTVSKWLESVVKQSHLKKYQTFTIKNGINIDAIHWNNEIEAKYAYLKNMKKEIILGVSNIWDERKGLEDFKELAHKISDKYIILLVGVNEKQIKNLPKNIIGIKRTDNQNELYYLYNIATVFFNPTKEETFGLTNIEAQAVGTPVVTYNSGGTSETIINKNCFMINNEINDFLHLLQKQNFKNMKINNVNLDLFDKNNFYQDYLKLYEMIMEKNNENISDRS